MVMHGVYNTYGVFFNPLQSEFGWSRTIISGASSLGSLMMGLFAMVAGNLTDKFGPRIIMIATGCVLGLGYFLMSQVNTLWNLVLFYGVMVGIGTSTADVSLLPMIAKWFARRMGIMSGVAKVGTGMGIIIMPPIASWLITNYGWRNSYITLGMVAMVAIVSLAQFLSRDPSQKGLKPYGEPEGVASGSYSVGKGLSLREAVHTRQLWAICAIYFLIFYSTMTIMIHIAPHAADIGASAAGAAGMISTIGGVSILGRLAMGATGDRIGHRRALAICLLVLIISFSWLQLAKGLWGLNLFVVIYGFAHGGFFALMSPLVAESFGTKSHGIILGMVIASGTIGSALGPVVTGRIFDVTRSYQPAFLILLVVSVTGFILSTLLRPMVKEPK